MTHDPKMNNCDCNHDHSHHEGGCCDHHHSEPKIQLTVEEEILLLLSSHRYLPVCQFLMGMGDEEDTQIAALSPVFMLNTGDDVKAIKEQGEILLALEQKGLITLDYDYPLKGYEYQEYKQSDAFKSFVESVNEGKRIKGFLFDTAKLETGSMALTEDGEKAAQQIQQKIDSSET